MEETRLVLFYWAAVIVSISITGIYGVYKKSLDGTGQVKNAYFQKGVTIFGKLLFVIILFGFVSSFIPAMLYYAGTCPADFIYYTRQRVECSFWKFYVYAWLVPFFSGIPPQL